MSTFTGSLLAGTLLVTALTSPAAAQLSSRVPARPTLTSRVNLSSSEQQVGGHNQFPCISSDGQYVAFASDSSKLVSGDTNSSWDIFLRDRLDGTTERVSVSSSGAQSNGDSALHSFSISGDGRYVAFWSAATNLVPGDTNGFTDVFIRDRQAGTTTRVSIGPQGEQGDASSSGCSLSADGRFVTFYSNASNLVAGDLNGVGDVFVGDLQAGFTELASVNSNEAQANGDSAARSVSADGRYVAFASIATNLVAGDTNGLHDVFVRDRQLGTTELVSVGMGGAPGDGHSGSGIYGMATSADGRYVIFDSEASNLVAMDTNGVRDVFVRDRQSGSTERVSIASGGAQANGSCYSGSISADGRYVAFSAEASNLVSGDTAGHFDVFVHDRQLAITIRASVPMFQVQANGSSGEPAISADARWVAFGSVAPNLVPADTNGSPDVFVRELR